MSRVRARGLGRLVVCAAVVVASGACRTASDLGGLADLGSLADRGRSTRSDTKLAAWTVRTEQRDGSSVLVDVVIAPVGRRWALSAETGGDVVPIVTIIERDGFWFVEQDKLRSRYRPFEAPLPLPILYLYLLRPDLVTVEPGVALGDLLHVRDQVATYRRPLPDEFVRQAATDAARLQREVDAARSDKQRARALLMLEATRGWLAAGVQTRIDVTTGIVLQRGLPGRRSWVTNFRTTNLDVEELFGIDGYTWVDHVAPAVLPANVAVLTQCPIWRQAVEKSGCDGGARFVDVDTGALRRVPFLGAVADTAVLTPDRRTAIVLGVDEHGLGGLFAIDLSTRSHRRLGKDVFEHGVGLFPTVSPDGATVAVVFSQRGSDQRRRRVLLVDIASGVAVPLGLPGSYSSVDWLADGQGLVVGLRAPATDAPAAHHLVVLRLDGTATLLGEGEKPVVLGDAVLYRDRSSLRWHLMDLDGDGVRPFFGGFFGAQSAAASPDGRHVLLVRADRTGGSSVSVVDAATGAERSIPNLQGLWTFPSW